MTAEPSETDHLCALAALKLGVLRLYDSGLGYIAPSLLGLSGRELEHAKKVGRHTLDRWAMVSLAAHRILVARQYHRAA